MKGKFFLVLSISTALIILIIIGYKEDGINLTPSYHTSSMRGLHLNHKKGGQLAWELFAENATFPEDKKEIFIDSIELKILNEPQVYISGGKSIYDLKSKDLYVTEKIEIKLKNGVLKTDSLRWISSEKTIATDKDIEFTSDSFTIKGTGLTAKVNEDKIRILRNVKGTFYR
ncbi:MAG: LPS export ABC transporter periplasmic protein LptC [Nitrospirae bacterium]|nr:LPS export ABC transporter periplasmic protein LptC [Nitrospirota bacterium]